MEQTLSYVPFVSAEMKVALACAGHHNRTYLEKGWNDDTQ